MLNLNEQERQILMLHAVTGLKHREIAEIMGKKPSAVSSLIYRAKKRMEKELEDIV